tara:strand:- start:5821 stop:6063 length:243 start_codon:yes stop_codon:yes gene_type:complete
MIILTIFIYIFITLLSTGILRAGMDMNKTQGDRFLALFLSLILGWLILPLSIIIWILMVLSALISGILDDITDFFESLFQ